MPKLKPKKQQQQFVKEEEESSSDAEEEEEESESSSNSSSSSSSSSESPSSSEEESCSSSEEESSSVASESTSEDGDGEEVSELQVDKEIIPVVVDDEKKPNELTNDAGRKTSLSKKPRTAKVTMHNGSLDGNAKKCPPEKLEAPTQAVASDNPTKRVLPIDQSAIRSRRQSDPRPIPSLPPFIPGKTGSCPNEHGDVVLMASPATPTASLDNTSSKAVGLDRPTKRMSLLEDDEVLVKRIDASPDVSLSPVSTIKNDSSGPCVLGDASVHLQASPAKSITYYQPIPTLESARDLRLEPSHDDSAGARKDEASVPAAENVPTNNAQKDFDPFDVVKSSLEPVAEQDDSCLAISRIVGVSGLAVGIILLLVTLVLVVTTAKPDVVQEDPRLEHAKAVRDASEQVLQNLMETSAAAATAISSRSLRREWPVLDDFELLASLTTAKATILCPVIAFDERQEWQNFAKNNTDWVEALGQVNPRRLQSGSAVLDSVTIDGGDTDNGTAAIDDSVTDSVVIPGDDSSSGTFNFIDPVKPDAILPQPNGGDPVIRIPFAIHASPRGGHLGSDDDTKEYVPVWQLSPIPKEDLSIVNFDVLRQPILRRLYEESKTTQRAAVSPPFRNSRVLFEDAFVFDGALTNTTKVSPLFVILQPVLNRIPQPNHIDAYLVCIYSWDDLSWRSPLPAKLVVDNNCGSASFAYELSQNGSKFLGEEAIEPTDDFVSTKFAAFYNGTSMCEYSLHYYVNVPALTGEDRPITSVVVLVLALVFIFVGTVLMLVDFAHRRYGSYKDLVNQGIRHQGYMIGHMGKDQNTSGGPWLGTGATGTKSKMIDDNVDECIVLESITANATVVYVTLDGFCEWSATCDAADAFALLDDLNSTFERLVTEYKLSKVDTVGSSFMAVCGIQQQREDHTYVASCFARDFFKTVHECLPELIDSLNVEVIGLSTKASIHCGEVESGFRISGPTVQKVHLMASIARANTIHVSPEAYHYLKDTDLANDIVGDPTDKQGDGWCVLSF